MTDDWTGEACPVRPAEPVGRRPNETQTAGAGAAASSARAPAGSVSAGSAFSLDDAHRLLGTVPFARWWGLRAVALGDGSASVLLPAAPHLIRPGGVLHGSCYEVVADVAMWLAIMTRIGEEQMALTIEMKTNFLRGTAGDITGTATVVTVGRRVVFGTALMTDAAGREVAYSTLTYIRPGPAAEPAG